MLRPPIAPDALEHDTRSRKGKVQPKAEFLPQAHNPLSFLNFAPSSSIRRELCASRAQLVEPNAQ